MKDRRQNKHKLIHYERLIQLGRYMDKALGNNFTNVGYGPLSNKFGEVVTEAHSHNLELLFEKINKTWKEEDNYLDPKYRVLIPNAFLENKELVNHFAILEKSYRAHQSVLSDEEFKDIAGDQGWEKTLFVQLRVLFHMFLFWKHHKRVYKLTGGLVQALENTDYPSKIEYVKMPHKSLYLVIPPEANLYMNRIGIRKRARIEGLYVNMLDVSGEGKTRMSVLVTHRVKRFDDISEEDIFYYETFLKKDLDVKDAIEAAISNWDSGSDEDSPNLAMIPKTIELIIKVFLYVSSINAKVIQRRAFESSEISQRDIRRKLPRFLSRLQFFEVGGNITIKPQKFIENPLRSTGGGHSYRYLVRGHYHGYWLKIKENIKEEHIIDTKEDGRVLVRKFIEPYWKGPEMGEVLLKNYKVDR